MKSDDESSDVVGDPKTWNLRGTTPTFWSLNLTWPQKLDPELTPTEKFYLKNPKPGGNSRNFRPPNLTRTRKADPKPDPNFCSPNTSLQPTKYEFLKHLCHSRSRKFWPGWRNKSNILVCTNTSFVVFIVFFKTEKYVVEKSRY